MAGPVFGPECICLRSGRYTQHRKRRLRAQVAPARRCIATLDDVDDAPAELGEWTWARIAPAGGDQNGLTTAKITMAIINSVGTSLMIL